MGEPGDAYQHQAPCYDTTRGVSASLLIPLLHALEGAPGTDLLDVGGGTGNYAAALRDRGWHPTLVDRSPSMLREARAKGLRTLEADATSLPLADATADAVTMINMLHQVADWRAALRETRRVLRAGGRLAVVLLAAEHIREVTWVFGWFPSMGAETLGRRPGIGEVLEELPGGRAQPVEFTDLADGSIAALCRFPERILEAAWREQTTFFETLANRNPEELRDGLARLRLALDAGRRPDAECATARSRIGDAILISWAAPGDGHP